MAESNHDSRRVAKNTLALFFRMAFLMIIALYTSRVILKALGVTDFGVYNVVGGFVSMFAIISSSLSASISRYLTVALGRGDGEQLSRIFSTSVTMLYLMCALLLVLLESFGIWFVNFKLNIPAGRMVAANWVFQFSVVTFLIDLMAMPYNAIVMSHERMTAYAYISIFEGLGKLTVAFLVMISPIDRLIFYAALMALVAVSVRVIYTVYCRRHFPESHYHFVWDKQLMKSMFGFSGWTFFGVTSSMLADQGVNMILNIFFGPVVNAARGLAGQVNSAVGSFQGSFMGALAPQLTKSYAAGERDFWISLVDRGARFSFFLYYIVALPVLITAPFLLKLWLGAVPEHTINFVRLVIISSFFGILSGPLINILTATGKIKVYQVVVGGSRFVILPVIWLFLKAGYAPEIAYLVTLGMDIINFGMRLWRMKVQTDFPIMAYLRKTAFTVLSIGVVSAVLPFLVNGIIASEWINFIVVCLISVLSATTIIYFFGVSVAERVFIRDKALQFVSSLKRH